MGSLDVRSAKRQFFMLVDSVSSSHLPSFAIWLDAKLAEYKTNGLLKPGDDEKENQQYPEWISKSLRQNLSFIFQGDNQAVPAASLDSSDSSSSQHNNRFTVGDKTAVKRRLDSEDFHGGKKPNVSDRSNSSDNSQLRNSQFAVTTEACEPGSADHTDNVVVIKEEGDSGDDSSNMSSKAITYTMPRPDNTETPMPFVQDAFSLHNTPGPSLSSYPSVSSVGKVDSGNTASMTPIKGSGVAYSDTSQNPSGFEVQNQQLSSPSIKLQEQFIPPPGGASFSHSSQPLEASGLKPGAMPAMATADDNHTEGLPTWVTPLKPNVKRKLVPDASGMYNCDICGKAFKSNADMSRHLRYHSGERPYGCPYCELRFTESGNCYQHQRNIHKGQPVLKCLP